MDGRTGFEIICQNLTYKISRLENYDNIMKEYLLDLFSGIGGFHLGFEKAGIEFDGVYYSDIDKYANAIYKYNFPKAKGLGDVKTINANELPKGRWRVTFGFPCQDLSIAGKRAGFEGKRSSLFYEAIRIIRDLQPDIFIFENVKGLFSADKGKAFINVLREIADIGLYDCEWQLVNTRWVLPQNRERIYFIGHFRGRSKPKVFPIRKNNTINSKIQQKQGKQEARASCLGTRYGQRWADETYIGCKQIGIVNSKDNMGQRIYNPNGIAVSIRAKGGGQGAKTGLYKVHNMQPRSPNRPSLKYLSGGSGHLQREDVSYCLDGGNTNTIEFNDMKIRRLTPTECERLQGFPDNFTQYGNFDRDIKEISDTQRYKCLGNAVTVDIVKMIVEKL